MSMSMSMVTVQFPLSILPSPARHSRPGPPIPIPVPILIAPFNIASRLPHRIPIYAFPRSTRASCNSTREGTQSHSTFFFLLSSFTKRLLTFLPLLPLPLPVRRLPSSVASMRRISLSLVPGHKVHSLHSARRHQSSMARPPPPVQSSRKKESNRN